MDDTVKTRPAPFDTGRLHEAFVDLGNSGLADLQPDEDPYRIMKVMEDSTAFHELTPSAANAGAAHASLILLGVMLATMPVPVKQEDPNVPGIRDLGPKPDEVPTTPGPPPPMTRATPEQLEAARTPGPDPDAELMAKAYSEGFDTYVTGKLESDSNPYVEGTQECNEWHRGYKAAAEGPQDMAGSPGPVMGTDAAAEAGSDADLPPAGSEADAGAGTPEHGHPHSSKDEHGGAQGAGGTAGGGEPAKE